MAYIALIILNNLRAKYVERTVINMQPSVKFLQYIDVYHFNKRTFPCQTKTTLSCK